MNILIMKLCFVFVVIIAILWMKRPLFWAISGGLAAALVLYGIRVPDALSIMGRSMVSKDTITVVLSFYFITFLQRMLERRNRLKQAEQSLNWLFNNRRVNASAAPAVIGLLPSAGAMTICAEIVRSSCQDYLSNEDMTCVTSFYRHIPESFLPTYSSILIALAVSGVGAGNSYLPCCRWWLLCSLSGTCSISERFPGPQGRRRRQAGKRRRSCCLRVCGPSY